MVPKCIQRNDSLSVIGTLNIFCSNNKEQKFELEKTLPLKQRKPTNIRASWSIGQ